jgi:hypothetical protein
VSEPRKHHYIPAFYVKQWATSENRLLCEHKLISGFGVKPRRTSPEGTGYQIDLYRMDGVPDGTAQRFEQQFMSLIDSHASDALGKFIAGDTDNWTSELRSSWAHFIVSLFFRNPEAVATIKGIIVEMWHTAMKSRNWMEDQKTLEAFFALDAANFLADLIASDRVGKTVFEMKWTRLDLSKSPHQLLTSDRPLVMPLGLANPKAYISLPLSPHVLFVASHEAFRFDAHPGKIARFINEQIVAQARKYVWGTTDAQLTFIRNRFGNLPDREHLTAQQLQDALDAVERWREREMP